MYGHKNMYICIFWFQSMKKCNRFSNGFIPDVFLCKSNRKVANNGAPTAYPFWSTLGHPRYSVVYLKYMKDIQRKQTYISSMTICTRLWPNVHLHSFNKLMINHWSYRWLSSVPEPAFFSQFFAWNIGNSPQKSCWNLMIFAFLSKDNFSI